MKWDDLPDRFRKKVRVGGDDECWDWTAATNQKGYGLCWSPQHGRLRLATRLVFEWMIGPIPKGLFVCHRCDRPSCCHWRHLYLTDNAGNMRDCVRKGRTAKGEKHGSAKLTQTQVEMIRKVYDEMEITQRDLGRCYGVDTKTVNFILLRTNWKHVP